MARVLLRYPNACTEGANPSFQNPSPFTFDALGLLRQGGRWERVSKRLMLCEGNFVVVLYFITEYLEESQ